MQHLQLSWIFSMYSRAVEPVLSGTVLNSHPLLSSQLSKSQKLSSLLIVSLTSIKRSPLLSTRSRPLLNPNEPFLLSSSILTVTL